MESKTNRVFKLASNDIATISGHIVELRVYMYKKCIDSLEVNVTLLDDSISSGKVTPPGLYTGKGKIGKRKRIDGGLPFISVLLLTMNARMILSAKALSGPVLRLSSRRWWEALGTRLFQMNSGDIKKVMERSKFNLGEEFTYKANK